MWIDQEGVQSSQMNGVRRMSNSYVDEVSLKEHSKKG